jgi:PAS domain-containing protein
MRRFYWYFDRNSSPNGVIGVYRDYAPVAKAIREETVVRAGVIVETAAESVALLDAEGKIVFANQKLADLLGRPPNTAGHRARRPAMSG